MPDALSYDLDILAIVSQCFKRVVLLFGIVLRIHLQSIEYQLAILVVIAEAHEEPDAIGRYI